MPPPSDVVNQAITHSFSHLYVLCWSRFLGLSVLVSNVKTKFVMSIRVKNSFMQVDFTSWALSASISSQASCEYRTEPLLSSGVLLLVHTGVSACFEIMTISYTQFLRYHNDNDVLLLNRKYSLPPNLDNNDCDTFCCFQSHERLQLLTYARQTCNDIFSCVMLCANSACNQGAYM